MEDVKDWLPVYISYRIPYGKLSLRGPIRSSINVVASSSQLPKELSISIDKCKRFVLERVVLFINKVLDRINHSISALPNSAVLLNRNAWSYVLYLPPSLVDSPATLT